MNSPTALDYWTLAIAVVGALTGVAALVTEVWGLMLAGPRVRVSLANAFVLSGGWTITVEVRNVGRMPASILELGLTFRSGSKENKIPLGLIPPGASRGPDLPFRLPDGEAESWLLDPTPIADVLSKNGSDGEVRAYARLATGKVRRSRRRLNAVIVARMD